MKKMLMLILAACGGRPVADEAEVSTPQDVGSDDDCPVGLTDCNGECVDLRTDDRNCGACGWSCRDPESFGGCEAGSCPSAMRCALNYHPGLETCEAVCAYYDQRCDDDPAPGGRGCGGDAFIYDSEISIEHVIHRCERDIEGTELYSGCDDPIGWTFMLGGGPFVEAVSCCCTQEPPP